MGEFVAVALKNSIYRTRGKPLQQQRYLIHLGTFALLGSLLLPNAESVIGGTVVSGVAE
jgi:hypothetical protein